MRRGCSSMNHRLPPASASGSRRCRKTSVVFATQSLADIKDSTIAPAIIESCASRIFLPNPQATEPQIRTICEGLRPQQPADRNRRHRAAQARLLHQSRLGNRLFDLDLGPAALAFAGVSTPQDQRDIDRVDAGRRSRLRRCVAAPSRPRLGRRPAAVLDGGGFPRFSSFRRFHHEDQVCCPSRLPPCCRCRCWPSSPHPR